jgi:hypothetical protein
MREVDTDVAVIGGGLGGVAGALAAARTGHRVVLTCHDDWLGGQLTSQAVPPDEHPWIERHGCTASYRRLRDGIRAHYRRWYPLTSTARAHPALNPGGGWVSGLCHEPTVAVAVIDALLAPWRTTGRLTILRARHPVSADVDGDRVHAVTVTGRGRRTTITARYVIDATELGDLLPLTGAEHVTGAEARADTGEPHAPPTARPDDMQAVSACFAVDHRPGEDHTVDRPASYARWRDQRLAGWPGRRFSFHGPDPHDPDGSIRHTFVPNPDGEPHATVAAHHADPAANDLWLFRRIVARRNFVPGHLDSDVTLVNWPMLDHVGGPVIGEDPEVAATQRAAARELAHSLLHWLQTEAPRPDGGAGFPGLRPRGDLLGSDDLLARDLYIRESRRIRARTTVVEQDVAAELRPGGRATSYPDSVGVGAYRMDLHPTTGGRPFFDVPSLPFEIPLGALVPVRMRNLLAGAKNLGTTHLTNGCYRLHPIEWNVGEVAGLLAGFCIDRAVEPGQVHTDPPLLAAFQALLDAQGVERRWPRGNAAINR